MRRNRVLAVVGCCIAAPIAHAQGLDDLSGIGRRRLREFYAPLTHASVEMLGGTGGRATTRFDTDPKDESAELAKQLSNPIADLISVPLQANWDYGIGSADATKFTLNVQPVIPIALNDDLNLITRTIVPILRAESPVHGGDTESGLGDILQSFFFSPMQEFDGWVVGAGPVFLYPTATDDELGGEKWGAGPTAVLLKQDHGWTYGALVNHVWSFAGSGNRNEISATFLQPFLAFTTKTYTTLTLNTESTYDWQTRKWTVPVNLQLTQLVKVASHPISFGIGGRYYVETPRGGPEWGTRFILTFLFPKKK